MAAGGPLKVERVAVDAIHPDPANVRRHDRKNLDAIKASLVAYGQQTPIVVDAKGVVLKGNGTLAAAKELGWAAIDAVRTGLSGAEARAYAIADNRTAELASWDDVALAEQLQAIRAEDDALLGAAGFTGDEVDGLLERLASGLVVPDVEPQSEPELKADHFVEIYCDDASLDEIRPSLDEWGKRGGITVNIS